MLIKKAAVIGAGTMGAGIASHLASAGVPCLLLDIVPPDLDRSRREDPAARSALARGAIEKGLKSKPPAFMVPGDVALVEPGNVEDHLSRLAECDWIIEAVTENLDLKRDLYRKIASCRRAGSIVSSNTSGLSLHLLVDGLDEEFRCHFLITHFFNPPRHMYLLELVKGRDTAPEIYETVRRFADRRLGKGVVDCKDTPNFIANRIGVFAMAASCRHMLETGLSVEEVDAVSGPPMGRPKTASFRLHDLVGNDVAVTVMKNMQRLVPEDESVALFEPPDFLERMVEEGKLGRKVGEGFYKKVGRDILVLDLETFEYRPRKEPSFPSLANARKGKDAAEKLRLLVEGDDPAARFAWKNISETILYSARRVPEIADDLPSIDRAIRWGFNWELGPFEIWDALGVRAVAERLRSDGHEMPPLVNDLLAAGRDRFYDFAGEGRDRRRVVFDPATKERTAIPPRPGVLLLDDVRERGAPVKRNDVAAVWDIGDGVLCVEFRSKMNTISTATLEMIREAVDEAERSDRAGVVIGNQAANFSAGADLAALLEAAREKRWKEIEAMIRGFHAVALRVRYSPKPVVAAVQGLALGGGCEIPLACDRVQAAAETYTGLVELGVGLIPAGGGTREIACRAFESAPAGDAASIWPFLSRSFEAIAQGKVSSSAAEAAELGYLTARDAISMNRDRALADARRVVVTLAESGYRPPRRRDAVRVAGAPGIAELRVLLHQYREGGFASDYDVYLAGRLACVLCGGEIDSENPVSEEHLLDLEREVFLELCGEQKTRERIEHMLKTGKPLRN